MEDLLAKFSRKESESFSASGDFAEEPVPAVLEMTADMFRDAMRTSGRVRLSPEAHSIPGGCMSPAMDYAIFDVLTRLDREVNKDRRMKREAAERYLDKLAKGEIIPESWQEDETAATGGPAAQLVNAAPNRVTPHGLMGY